MNLKHHNFSLTQCVISKVITAASLAVILMNFAAAQETTSLSVEMDMSVPVTLSCTTDVNGGVLNILDESVLASSTASERSWFLIPGQSIAGGASINTAAFAVSGASSGECTVGGVSDGTTLEVGFSDDNGNGAGVIDLSGDQTGNPTLTASLSVLKGAPDDSGYDSSTQLTIDTSQAGDNLRPGYSFDASAGTLTVPIGFMSIEIPQNSATGALVGIYTGTGTVEVTLL